MSAANTSVPVTLRRSPGLFRPGEPRRATAPHRERAAIAWAAILRGPRTEVQVATTVAWCAGATTVLVAAKTALDVYAAWKARHGPTATRAR